ncbi:MAG: 50S ribosomal protein L10 [Chloroflexi bacterium]|nr:50S ribosomal protein L10 [Chloroflexota bacterium]
MKKEEKATLIDEVEKQLAESKLVVATDYRGLTAAEMTRLRKQLRDAGVEFHVVKNTLTLIAAGKTGKSAVEPLLKGPTAMAFGKKDEVTAAKTLTNYIRMTRSALQIKGGLLGQKLITTAEIQNLAMLPSKEVLVARVLGQLNAPVATLLGLLSAPMAGLAGVLQGRIKQLESSPAAAPAAQPAQ